MDVRRGGRLDILGGQRVADLALAGIDPKHGGAGAVGIARAGPFGGAGHLQGEAAAAILGGGDGGERQRAERRQRQQGQSFHRKAPSVRARRAQHQEAQQAAHAD